MPVAFQETSEFAEFVVTDSCIHTDVIDAVEKYYPSKKPKLVLWNLEGSSLSELSQEQFREIMAVAGKYAGMRGADAKTVFVVKDDIERALIRTYADLASTKIAARYNITLSREDAIAWLLAPMG